MLEMRSSLVASALTAAVGLSIAVATPAAAAGSATAKPAAKKAPKKQGGKKALPKQAAAKTVTACVSKKSGATKVLLGSKAKKKCAKGWSKMTWNVAGPAGANGASGANGANGAPGAAGAKGADGGALLVRDAASNRIGRYAGVPASSALFPLVQVLGDDGGIYTYLESGQLAPSALTAVGGGGGLAAVQPQFTNSACAGSGVLFAPAASEALLSLFVGGTTRIVHRTLVGPRITDMSPARVWKLSTTITTITVAPPAVYELDPAGVCAPTAAPAAGYVAVTLDAIPAPPDGVGRLVIG